MNKKNESVMAVFDTHPSAIRSKLKKLRAIILDVARNTEGVGKLEETLRWGQPSYITSETRSGSLVRIDAVRKMPSKYGIYFHCQTGLVDNFRAIYPETFEFDGKRAIILDSKDEIPEDELRHCISMALTHKLNKR